MKRSVFIAMLAVFALILAVPGVGMALTRITPWPAAFSLMVTFEGPDRLRQIPINNGVITRGCSDESGVPASDLKVVYLPYDNGEFVVWNRVLEQTECYIMTLPSVGGIFEAVDLGSRTPSGMNIAGHNPIAGPSQGDFMSPDLVGSFLYTGRIKDNKFFLNGKVQASSVADQYLLNGTITIQGSALLE